MHDLIKNRRKISEIRKNMIKINQQKPSEEELNNLVDILNAITQSSSQDQS